MDGELMAIALKRISCRMVGGGWILYWEFWRQNAAKQDIRHEIKAAACVSRDWPGKPGDAKWETAAEAWAQGAAQGVWDRLDDEESPTGLKAAVQEEYDRLKDNSDADTERRAELKELYPTLTDARLLR